MNWEWVYDSFSNVRPSGDYSVELMHLNQFTQLTIQYWITTGLDLEILAESKLASWDVSLM